MAHTISGFSLDNDYAVTYAYDALGRFSSITSAISASSAVQYSYLPDSDLVAGWTETILCGLVFEDFPWVVVYPRLDIMNKLYAEFADIPFLVPQITENHLRLMHAVIGYLAISNIPRVHVNSLCVEWGLGKEKLYQLLDAMERAHLIRVIRRKRDTKIHSVGAKVFLYEPSVYSFFGSNPGARREAYVVGALFESNHRVWAARKDEEYDFLVDEKTVEVGGRTKTRKRADFVVRDDLELPTEKTLPMWLLGLEY